jgi:hypothetical protein
MYMASQASGGFRWPWQRQRSAAKLFISYSRKDLAAALRLSGRLASAGYDVWFDQQLTGGQQWWDAILQAIRQADVFLFCLSTASLDSAACHQEYTYAQDLRRHILPVLVADGVDLRLLPEALQAIQVVDYRAVDDGAWARLREALDHLGPSRPLPRPLPPSPAIPVSPLGQLKAQLDAPHLSLEEQATILHELKGLLADTQMSAEARQLLQQLARRRDALASIAFEADALLQQNHRSLKAATTQDQGDIALSISTLAMGKSGAGNPVRYTVTETATDITIAPAHSYLNQLRNGQPVPPVAPGMIWNWELPALDIKLVNNTSQTIFFHDAYLRVEYSVPDLSPILLVDNGSFAHPRKLRLINDGWSAAREITLAYSIIPYTPHLDGSAYNGPFMQTLSLGDIDDRLDVDLSPQLAQLGVDVDELAKTDDLTTMQEIMRWQGQHDLNEYHRRYCGPFVDGTALVYGELRYTGPASALPGSTTYHSRFYTQLYLHRDLVGGAMLPPGPQYQVPLRADANDYVAHIPISQVLKPGEADRFSIALGVGQSAKQRFTLDLMYNGEQHIISKPIILWAFVPRTDAQRATQLEIV